MVKTRSESTRISIDDIVVVERRLRQIFLVTTERIILFYDKLRYIEPLLGDNFYRILDGCFVNMDRAISARDGVLLFDNGYEMALSEKSFVRAKQTHHAYNRVKQLRGVNERNGDNKR